MDRLPLGVRAVLVGTALVALAGSAGGQETISFLNASQELDFVRGGNLGGAAWFDYDNDGFLDLYLTNSPGSPNALFRNNRDGTFTDVTEEAGVGNVLGSTGALAGDIDNDGWADLFLTGAGGVGGSVHSPTRFFRNRGDGTFADITEQSEVVGTPSSWSPAFADVNNDGLLDLFVGSAGSLGLKVQHKNTLYLNDGDLSFTDFSEQAGIDTDLGACAAGFSDFDNDGIVDLFVPDCNEVFFAPTPIELFRSRGDGTFEDVTAPARLTPGGFWMGIAFSDYDHDGDIDIFSTNLGVTTNFRNALYENNGNGTFSDVSPRAGVRDLAFGWGCSFADFDNDGYDDLALVGSLNGAPGFGSNPGNPGQLVMNNGDKTFRNASQLLGINLAADLTSGVAVGDLDNNGFPDLLMIRSVAHGDPVLLRNEGNDNRWLEIRTVGATGKSNRDGIGARVEVAAGDMEQVKEVRAGSSFASTDSRWLTFGVGEHEVVDRVTIRWPSGTVDEFTDVRTRQAVVAREGEGLSPAFDCDGNDVSDTIDIADGTAADCNGNSVPDGCELAAGAPDCDANGVPDECDADCNRDGIPDACELADGTSADCNGNGVPDECDILPSGFGFEDPVPHATGSAADDVIAADLDGDRDRDVAVVSGSSDSISTLMNSGDGTLLEPSSRAVGEGPSSVAAGDLDRDGNADLVVGYSGSFGRVPVAISVLMSAGDGSFDDPVDHPVGRRPSSVVVVDLDGDGHLDVATANESSDDVSVLLNEGGGRLGAESRHGAGDLPLDLAAVDFDVDGDLDLLTLDRNSRTVTLLAGDGRGGFSASETVGELPWSPASFAVGDFDDDGDPDAAVAARLTNELAILLRGSDGRLVESAIHVFGSTAVRIDGVMADDLTGDGKTDIGVALSDGKLAVLENLGGGGFGGAGSFELGSRALGSSAADLDGDGTLDVAVTASDPDGVAILVNTSLPAVSGDCDGSSTPDECDLAEGRLADENGDGVPDPCELTKFVRGNANAVGGTDISDAVFIFVFLFRDGQAPPCAGSADANASGGIDIADGTYLLNFLFNRGPAPPAPYPGCGVDETAGADCESHPPCAE